MTEEKRDIKTRDGHLHNRSLTGLPKYKYYISAANRDLWGSAGEEVRLDSRTRPSCSNHGDGTKWAIIGQ